MNKNFMYAGALVVFAFSGLAVNHLMAAAHEETMQEQYEIEQTRPYYPEEIMGEPVTQPGEEGTDMPFEGDVPEEEMHKENMN